MKTNTVLWISFGERQNKNWRTSRGFRYIPLISFSSLNQDNGNRYWRTGKLTDLELFKGSISVEALISCATYTTHLYHASVFLAAEIVIATLNNHYQFNTVPHFIFDFEAFTWLEQWETVITTVNMIPATLPKNSFSSPVFWRCLGRRDGCKINSRCSSIHGQRRCGICHIQIDAPL